MKLEIAQSEQDVSPFCKESDMTYSWKRQFGLLLHDLFARLVTCSAVQTPNNIGATVNCHVADQCLAQVSGYERRLT